MCGIGRSRAWLKRLFENSDGAALLPKSAQPEGLSGERRLMRRKARRYTPVSASPFSCYPAVRRSTQPPSELSNGLLSLRAVAAGFAAALLDQPDAFDAHAALERLGHVV